MKNDIRLSDVAGPAVQTGNTKTGARVQLRDVAKSFGDVEVLKPLTLDIRPGEFVTLLGPSGCGKSTTLNVIAGLESPSSGSVHLDDRDVTGLSPQRRDIAMVFQSYALYPHLTAFDNIAFPLRLRRRHTDAMHIEAEVSRVAEALELTALLDRRPAQLSGGQRQRVSLGRAVVRNPNLFLFDEPLSNLDNRLRIGMRSTIKELHTESKATMVWVTHDQVEAMVLSDRIAVMNQGQLQQMGTPDELYRRPANAFVAQFLGERGMNMFRGEILTTDPRAFHSEVGIVRLDKAYAAQSNLLLGVRPEEVIVDPNGSLIGTVRTVEPTGDRTYLNVRFADQDFLTMTTTDPIERPGDTVRLSIRESATISIFDTADGKRMDAVRP